MPKNRNKEDGTSDFITRTIYTNFILSENIIGGDLPHVMRLFDLKGSLYARLEEVTEKELINGSGMIQLKD